MVEMTEDEMIVIEERGGLKNGQMPWPYVYLLHRLASS
jgi:hypothetical protein